MCMHASIRFQVSPQQRNNITDKDARLPRTPNIRHVCHGTLGLPRCFLNATCVRPSLFHQHAHVEPRLPHPPPTTSGRHGHVHVLRIHRCRAPQEGRHVRQGTPLQQRPNLRRRRAIVARASAQSPRGLLPCVARNRSSLWTSRRLPHSLEVARHPRRVRYPLRLRPYAPCDPDQEGPAKAETCTEAHSRFRCVGCAFLRR